MNIFQDEVVYIDNAPDFPIYMGKGSERRKKSYLLKLLK